MNPDNLKKEINDIFENFTGIRIVFIVKDEENYKLKISKIAAESLPNITQGFKNSLNDDIINNEDITVPLLSDYDDRKNAIFPFDYEQEPKEFGFIRDAIRIPPTSQDYYDFDGKFKDIKGIIIQLRGNDKCLSLYKNKTPLTVFEQSRKMCNLIPDPNGYLKELPEQVFRLDFKYDLMLIDGKFLIKNQNTLEKTMNFHKIIEAQALVALEALKASSLIHDISHLEKNSRELTVSRKLAKISKHSPVLGVIDAPLIIDYVKQHTYLSKVMLISEDGNHLIVKTKVSQKHFIKLMSDDYLESPLTKILYDSLAKDKIITDS